MGGGRPPKLRHKPQLKGQRQAEANRNDVNNLRSQLTQEQADVMRINDAIRHRELVVDEYSK